MIERFGIKWTSRDACAWEGPWPGGARIESHVHSLS